MAGGGVAGTTRASKYNQRPTHHKVIRISMYTRDLEELDAKVAELGRRGWTKANKSQLIRLALSQIDVTAAADSAAVSAALRST